MTDGRWQAEDGGWVWRDSSYYDPLWDDREAEQATTDYQSAYDHPLRVYYDYNAGEYRCHCPKYRDDGICHHLIRYRPTRDVKVDERYL